MSAQSKMNRRPAAFPNNLWPRQKNTNTSWCKTALAYREQSHDAFIHSVKFFAHQLLAYTTTLKGNKVSGASLFNAMG